MQAQTPPAPILVLDNGAHSIKTAWAHPESGPSAVPPPVQTFRNTIARSKAAKRNFVADELTDACDDYGGLTFRVPMERGILNNWEVEKTIWDRVFGHAGRGLRISPPETNLLVTEPVFNLPNVQEHYDQMVFEDYDFASYLRCPAAALIPYGADARGDPHYPTPPPECVLVIDAGHSFTHVVPVLRGRIVSHAAKRIDVGGKLLTNYLKELVSFRHWYMMDQTAVMEHAKEQACYVSTQWEKDWETANQPTNPIVRTFVLPDFIPSSKNKLGYVRTGRTPPPPSPPTLDAQAPGSGVHTPHPQQQQLEEEQLLHLCNERFTVPEVLFNPTTIDLNQAGIAETVAVVIAALPQEVQGMCWANIVCIGGSTQFPGFVERLRQDLRAFAPTDYDVRISLSTAPTLSAAASAAAHLSAPAPSHFNPPLNPGALVTRQEYQEGGSNACRRKFAAFYTKGGEEEVRRLALAPGWP